ncbi:DUF222 domain-containing protein [Microbacterium sp.]|uniref:HNH endonuclease n=1 Tax=Microbacterium sp. TaxID=51671 RepID=UPI0039E33BD9
MATPLLDSFHAAVARVDEAWACAESAAALTRAQLVQASEAMAVLQRLLGGLRAELAAAIAHESRVELGSGGLAKEQGFRTASAMIAAASGSSTGDAARLINVGEATAPRTNLLGEPLPPKYPEIQRALAEGVLGMEAAAAIVGLLDRVGFKAGTERVSEAERLLVERAPGLSLDEVRKLIARAEAWLDPDGVAPREDEVRGQRSLTMFERNGALHVNFRTDAASGAAVKAAIQAHVSATFRARRDALDPQALDADHRSVAMVQADALVDICSHVAGCDNGGLPMPGATVVVRVNHDELVSGAGSARIDGTDQPISINACRRLAAGGGVIAAVLASDGEILDWGREKRLFTRAQRLALVERDGGCVMCALPPQMTKAHHLRWWARDAGPTDLSNGVLLCESCHHRIHENGWDIEVDGTGVSARVWIIPPPHVDPLRTPRLGGRARYDIAA